MCISLGWCAQADKRISAGPAARHHPEDVHVQPHAGSAPFHHPHGVHEEERAGECGAVAAAVVKTLGRCAVTVE